MGTFLMLTRRQASSDIMTSADTPITACSLIVISSMRKPNYHLPRYCITMRDSGRYLPWMSATR